MYQRPPRRRKAILLLASLLLSSAAVLFGPAQGGEAPAFEWGEDIQLSESTDASDDATVALTPDGGMVMAWRERQVGRYSVFFVLLDGEGNIIGQRKQLGENLSASMDPVVAVDSDGRLHFVWTAMEDQELWYARADRGGDIDKGPERLTEAEGDSAEASVWMDNRDHLHIVWFDGRDGVTRLYYMQLDRNGRKVVEDTRLVQTRTEQESAVAMDPRGDLHVVWNALAPAGQLQWNSEVHYTKVSSMGRVLVADRVIGTSRGKIGYPDIAVDLSNTVHVVWPEGVGPREMVAYAELDSSGRLRNTRVVVDEAIQGAGDVALAVDGNNQLHLVWSQGPTGSGEVHYRTLDDFGIPLGDPVQLTDDIGDSRYPAIGLSLKGEPRIAWSDWRSGNAEVYLKVATLPVSGVDLAVYARDITLDPPTVTADEPFNMTFLVHNQGESRVDRSDFSLTVDGKVVAMGIIHNIPPGGVTGYTICLTMDEGAHRVEVSAFPTDVEDLAVHNNVATISVVAHPPGQLVADAGPDILAVAGQVTYFDASGTVYRGTGVLSYEWDMGTFSPKVFGEYVEHVYEVAGWYTASVRVSDGVVEDTDTCLVHVEERDEPPHAVIVPEGPIVGDRLEPVRLSAEGSEDDREIVNLTWNMGDGTVLWGWGVTHLYTETGVYPVTLVVEDSGGLIDINRTTVTVENLRPEITHVSGPGKVEVGERATFRVAATDADGEVSQYVWDFDASDGISFEAVGTEVTHKFGRAGTYNVTCIVRDDDGGQTVVHLEVQVVEREGSGVPAVPMGIALMAMLVAAVLYGLVDKRPYQSE